MTMCLISPFRYTCCDRTYVEVTKLDSSCPAGWPLEKCPEDLCIVQGPRGREKRQLMQGICWRCQAMREGLDGETYEARRPPIDNAFMVEGLENCNLDERRRKAEHFGNCWHCGASSDGVRDCEHCEGTGSARKGKNKYTEDGVEAAPVRKKRRTSTAVGEGITPKPKRGRPPGGGKKKKLGTIKEEAQMNLYPSLMDSNNAFQQRGFDPDIPASSYNNYSWESADYQGDPTLPSYGMDIDDNPYSAQPNILPAYRTNQASLHQYSSMADYTVNPQQVERSTMGYHGHLHPSIEFDHDASHGESGDGDGGEGVRSATNVGTSENQFAQFSTGMETTHDDVYLSHDDWPPYTEGLTYPSSEDTNNDFAPTVHDTRPGVQVAPVAQMTMDRFSPKPPYLPSPTLSDAHIAQHAPQDTSTPTSASVSTSTSDSTANVSAVAPLSASRLVTPP